MVKKIITRAVPLLTLLGFALVLLAQGTLRIAISSFPVSLNPVYATDETSQGVMNKMYQSLFCFDAWGHLKPELVEEYTFDERALAISLSLRRGFHFSHGQEVRSADVAATIELLLNPEFAYPYQADLGFIGRVRVTGPYRLTLFLKHRYAPWKNYLVFKVLCAGEIKDALPANFKNCTPLGSGPFRIARLIAPSRLELEKNPYRQNDCSYDNIEYSVLLDNRLAPFKLRAKEIDAAEIDPEDAQFFLTSKRWQERFRLLKYKKFGFTYLTFNLGNPAVDKNLRRLIFNRLATGSFLDRYLVQRGERVYSPFLLMANATPPLPFQTEPLSREYRLRILTNSESRLRRNLVLFICEELKAAHIHLQPVFVEYQTMLKFLKTGNFDLAVSGFLLDIDWNLRDIMASDSDFNYARFSRRDMDELLQRGLQEMDEVKRKGIYLQAHRLWLDELPFIPLFNLYYYMGISRQVRIPPNRYQLVGSSGDFFYDLGGW